MDDTTKTMLETHGDSIFDGILSTAVWTLGAVICFHFWKKWKNWRNKGRTKVVPHRNRNINRKKNQTINPALEKSEQHRTYVANLFEVFGWIGLMQYGAMQYQLIDKHTMILRIEGYCLMAEVCIIWYWATRVIPQTKKTIKHGIGIAVWMVVFMFLAARYVIPPLTDWMVKHHEAQEQAQGT